VFCISGYWLIMVPYGDDYCVTSVMFDFKYRHVNCYFLTAYSFYPYMESDSLIQYNLNVLLAKQHSFCAQLS